MKGEYTKHILQWSNFYVFWSIHIHKMKQFMFKKLCDNSKSSAQTRKDLANCQSEQLAVCSLHFFGFKSQIKESFLSVFTYNLTQNIMYFLHISTIIFMYWKQKQEKLYWKLKQEIYYLLMNGTYHETNTFQICY